MHKRIISFDVGIKNMAYCVFDLLEDNAFTVMDWNVLNLTEAGASPPQSTQTCTCILTVKKENRICGKKAKFMKNQMYYCDKHVATSGYIPFKKEYTDIVLKKKKKEDLLKLAHIHFINVSLLSHKPSILSALQTHFSNKMLEPVQIKKEKTADETDLITIGKQMKNRLNQIDYIPSITHVIIENQISPIANRMKTIQGMLTQYFIMVGNPDVKIEFISSHNKLKGHSLGSASVTEDETGASSTAKSAYRQHKKDGIQICSQFIEQHEWMHKWRDVMLHSKKDDYADAFLQGIWYIRNRLK
jgi:hypothetical protein